MVALAAAWAGASCGGRDQAQTAESAEAPPTAATVTSAEFGQLSWLEGDWRGHGVDQSPFYERYRFVDDSTLLVESFADSTLAQVTRVSRVELRAGQVVDRGESSRYVLTELDSAQAFFAPLEGVSNSFRWRRGASPDTWTATVLWIDDSGARGERVYQLERIR
jgi:hypothetical protein